LVLAKKVYAEYGCTFDLHAFPFDEQKCQMSFKMASAESKYVRLRRMNVENGGQTSLLEFFIDDFDAVEGQVITLTAH